MAKETIDPAGIAALTPGAVPATVPAVPTVSPETARELKAAEKRAQALVRQQERARKPPKSARALEKWVHEVDLDLFEWDLTAAPKTRKPPE